MHGCRDRKKQADGVPMSLLVVPVEKCQILRGGYEIASLKCSEKSKDARGLRCQATAGSNKLPPTLGFARLVIVVSCLQWCASLYHMFPVADLTAGNTLTLGVRSSTWELVWPQSYARTTIRHSQAGSGYAQALPRQICLWSYSQSSCTHTGDLFADLCSSLASSSNLQVVSLHQ